MAPGIHVARDESKGHWYEAGSHRAKSIEGATLIIMMADDRK